MPSLRLFGPARQAAGVSQIDVVGHTVGQVLATAESLFGPEFAEVVTASRVWVNGETATVEAPVSEDDEVAVIPPVSGG
jgi:molybdopterin converting factor small subunit